MVNLFHLRALLNDNNSLISSILLSIDIFGEKRQLTIKGKEASPSACGSFASVLVMLIVLTYTVKKLQVMESYGDTMIDRIVVENAITKFD